MAVGTATAIALALAASSAASGAMANKSKTATQTSSPTLDPQYGGLQQMLLQSIQKRLGSPSALPEGYETGGIGKINNAFDIIGQTQQNNLTARGLGSSPIAGAVDAKRELGRAGEIGQFQAGLPIVQRQMENENFDLASILLGQGRGMQTTQRTPGNAWAGGMGEMGSILGYLYGQGQFGGGNKPFTGSPSYRY